jgi:hypothetical protein
VRDGLCPQRLGLPGILAHRQRVEGVPHPKIGQGPGQPRQFVVAEFRGVGHPSGRGDGRFDVGARRVVRTLRRIRFAVPDDVGERVGPGGIDDFDHLLQLGASGVQPAPVQNRRHGQRRRRRVIHSARVSAAVGAMPPPACGDPVDNVRREQFDPAAGQRRRQTFGQLTVFVVAHPASRAVLVDQHRDRRIGFRRRGHVGDVRERVQQFLRKVNAHNASHFAAVHGDEHEGFLRHETEHGG